MRLHASALADVGQRRKNNEDSVFADSRAGLFIVADGMGGHAAGEVASRMAVEVVCRHLVHSSVQEPAKALAAAFSEATCAIRQRAADNPAQKGMGTTLSVLYLRNDRLFLAHVGDSRIYRLRRERLEQLSIDHSLVAEQVRQGLISVEEARQSQMRNILLQAVGLEETLDVFHTQQSVEAGDIYLLCSDGLTDMLDDRGIAALLTRHEEPDLLARGLVDAANNAGGRDNIGVVVIKVDDDEQHQTT